MAKRTSKHEENGTAGEPTHVPEQAATPPSEDEKVQPVHAIRLKNVRAAVWVNERDGAQFFNVTFSRSYRGQDGNWHTSDGFGRDDLLLLAKVADQAHTWIWAQLQSNGGEVPF